MSAYQVTDLHINALVTWAITRPGDSMGTNYFWEGAGRYINKGTAPRIASVLFAQNVRSVNARYQDSDPAHGFKFAPALGLLSYLSAVQIIKACHCLEYQSCETDDYESTEACAILRGIVKRACAALPGYDAALWGMPDVPARPVMTQAPRA